MGSPPPSPAAAPITVIGDGLAGTLLALSLADRGARVQLVGSAREQATALSYGAVLPGPPSRDWQRLQRRHGPLGWQPSGLVLHEARPGLPRQLVRLSQWIPLPMSRVDPPAWQAARLGALAAAGVHLVSSRVRALTTQPGGGWRLDLDPAGAGEAGLSAETVVLAAGAGSRLLWPALPSPLRHSWAGVLLVGAGAPANPWLDQARRGRIVQPRQWLRPALEASAAAPAESAWIVDAGMAPWGDGVVVGQITWIPPAESGPSSASTLAPPDPQWMEERLREGLRELDPQLSALSAPYRQVPVSFCLDGQPLVGPIAEAPGLWVFAGFSAAFSRVPAAAEALASRLLAQPAGRIQ